MIYFLLVLFCLIFGYLSKRFGLVCEGFYKKINLLVIYIGLPAIALRYIPYIEWRLSYLFTSILPFIVFGFSFIFFSYIKKSWLLSNKTFTTLVLVSGLSNTSFVGFPLIIAFFGEEQLKVGIVSDQVTFFALSTLGVLLASNWSAVSNSHLDKCKFIVRRIFTFPPFIACCIAFIWGRELQNDTLQSILQYFVMAVSPLALYSIGLQMKFGNFFKEYKVIGVSLLFKLILAPAICVLVALLWGMRGVFYQVSVFEMAMPSLVASSIVIERFGLNTRLANRIIGFSIIIGLFTAFLWYSVINTLL